MILVRHGETLWNIHYGRTRIDPGIPDPPLTSAGRAQARRLTRELAAQGVTRLLSSPYRRALETASIIARGLDLAITVEPLVRERCAFSCDLGTPLSLLRGDWPELDFGRPRGAVVGRAGGDHGQPRATFCRVSRQDRRSARARPDRGDQSLGLHPGSDRP